MTCILSKFGAEGEILFFCYLILFILRAEKNLHAHLAVVETWADFLQNLDQKKIVMAPFCGGKECEEKVKKDSAR